MVTQRDTARMYSNELHHCLYFWGFQDFVSSKFDGETERERERERGREREREKEKGGCNICLIKLNVNFSGSPQS